MIDRVYEGFLAQQFEQGMRLAANSDVLDLVPFARGAAAPDRYLAIFQCVGALQGARGEVTPQMSQFHVGIAFQHDYLRRVNPARLVTYLGPHNIVHPNVRPPFMCLGRIAPGAELVDLLYQVFEIITYFKWASHDALDRAGADWARKSQSLFPLDRRPLARRRLSLDVRPE